MKLVEYALRGLLIGILMGTFYGIGSFFWNQEDTNELVFITEDEEQAKLFVELIHNGDEKYSIKQEIKKDGKIIIEYNVIQDHKLLDEKGKFKTKNEKTYEKFKKILLDNKYKLEESGYDYEKEIFIVNYEYKEVEY